MTAQTKGVDALAVLDSQIAELRASGDTGNVENLLEAWEAFAQAIALLRVSAGNVRSLGAAGALEALPHGPYGEWLRQLDAAVARCGATP